MNLCYFIYSVEMAVRGTKKSIRDTVNSVSIYIGVFILRSNPTVSAKRPFSEGRYFFWLEALKSQCLCGVASP